MPLLFLPLISHALENETSKLVDGVKRLAVAVGGSIVVIGWVIAGILWLVSAGSPEKTGVAKKAIWAAVIGTVLVVIAGVSSNLIIDALGMNGAVPLCP